MTNYHTYMLTFDEGLPQFGIGFRPKRFHRCYYGRFLQLLTISMRMKEYGMWWVVKLMQEKYEHPQRFLQYWSGTHYPPSAGSKFKCKKTWTWQKTERVGKLHTWFDWGGECSEMSFTGSGGRPDVSFEGVLVFIWCRRIWFSDSTSEYFSSSLLKRNCKWLTKGHNFT